MDSLMTLIAESRDLGRLGLGLGLFAEPVWSSWVGEAGGLAWPRLRQLSENRGRGGSS